jgi:hypothetical protein
MQLKLQRVSFASCLPRLKLISVPICFVLHFAISRFVARRLNSFSSSHVCSDTAAAPYLSALLLSLSVASCSLLSCLALPPSTFVTAASSARFGSRSFYYSLRCLFYFALWPLQQQPPHFSVFYASQQRPLFGAGAAGPLSLSSNDTVHASKGSCASRKCVEVMERSIGRS